LDVQVKSFASVVSEDTFSYRLSVKNYDELRDETLQVARILVVVVVPEDPAEWLAQTETELAMRRCGYWISLRGQPPSGNEATVTLRISRVQVFDIEQLCRLMTQIANGGAP
jgi:hypothetical protein